MPARRGRMLCRVDPRWRTHMIYELRVYHCVPGRLPDLIKRFDTITLKLREKHAIHQAGFWTARVGASTPRLAYLPKRESLAHRETNIPKVGSRWQRTRPPANTEETN